MWDSDENENIAERGTPDKTMKKPCSFTTESNL